MEYRYKVHFSAIKDGRRASTDAEITADRPLESAHDGEYTIVAALASKYSVTDVRIHTIQLL